MTNPVACWRPLSPALLLVIACKVSPSPPTGAATASPRVVPPAPSQALAPPPQGTLSTAVFVDSKLGACIDYTGPQDALAILAGGAGTVLRQSCDSLGQTALTTCKQTMKGVTQLVHYYDLKHSDKYTAKCVQDGGEWTKNSSAEA